MSSTSLHIKSPVEQELFRKAKILAAANGKSFAEFVFDLIQEQVQLNQEFFDAEAGLHISERTGGLRAESRNVLHVVSGGRSAAPATPNTSNGGGFRV